MLQLSYLKPQGVASGGVASLQGFLTSHVPCALSVCSVSVRFSSVMYIAAVTCRQAWQHHRRITAWLCALGPGAVQV